MAVFVANVINTFFQSISDRISDWLLDRFQSPTHTEAVSLRVMVSSWTSISLTSLMPLLLSLFYSPKTDFSFGWFYKRIPSLAANIILDCAIHILMDSFHFSTIITSALTLLTHPWLTPYQLDEMNDPEEFDFSSDLQYFVSLVVNAVVIAPLFPAVFTFEFFCFVAKSVTFYNGLLTYNTVPRNLDPTIVNSFIVTFRISDVYYAVFVAISLFLMVNQTNGIETFIDKELFLVFFYMLLVGAVCLYVIVDSMNYFMTVVQKRVDERTLFGRILRFLFSDEEENSSAEDEIDESQGRDVTTLLPYLDEYVELHPMYSRCIRESSNGDSAGAIRFVTFVDRLSDGQEHTNAQKCWLGPSGTENRDRKTFSELHFHSRVRELPEKLPNPLDVRVDAAVLPFCDTSYILLIIMRSLFIHKKKQKEQNSTKRTVNKDVRNRMSA